VKVNAVGAKGGGCREGENTKISSAGIDEIARGSHEKKVGRNGRRRVSTLSLEKALAEYYAGNVPEDENQGVKTRWMPEGS